MIVTESVLDFLPSDTVSSKTNVSAWVEVNVGDIAVVSDSVCGTPDVCDQEYVIVSPSGSELPDPSNVTSNGVGPTDWSFPAFVIGAWLLEPPPMKIGD